MRVHNLTVTKEFQLEELQRLSREASRFTADVQIEFERESARYKIDLKSILGMMLLSLHRGTEITLRTKGKDEEEAIHWLCEALESRGTS